MNLFASSYGPDEQLLPLEDAHIRYYPSFFTSEEAFLYYSVLLKETQWQEDTITVFGQTHPQPRLTALYGTEGKSYSYSGITMLPKPFTAMLTTIRNKIEAVSKEKFNTVLLNLYRSGQDSNGWHSDDEKELGSNPAIASISFGAPRMFHFKHKKKALRHKIVLENGSLLLMEGATQHHWQHQLPKTKKTIAPRINLTFRKII